MKWLTIADIKKQLRVDFDDEDDVLELYGSAAEDTVLNCLNRTYQDVLEEYGEVPTAIRQATLMLVDSSYNHRSPAEPTQMYYVTYGFDILIKPYMRLISSDNQSQRISTYTIGSQIKILIEAVLPDNLTLFDVDFDVVVYNDDKKDQKKKYKKKECILTDEYDYVVLVDSDELGVGTYMVKLTVYITDTDFPDGRRKEVIRINPNVKVTG